MTDPFRRAQITLPDRERTPTIPADAVPHPITAAFDALSPDRQVIAVELVHLLSQMGLEDARMMRAIARRLARV